MPETVQETDMEHDDDAMIDKAFFMTFQSKHAFPITALATSVSNEEVDFI